MSYRGRLIPAHAGKTLQVAPVLLHSTAHPRSRGENVRARSHALRRVGSSPLTRGKLRVARTGQVVDGLIPAHAGKTRSSRCPARATSAHPRSRGRTNEAPSTTVYNMGSSPLTRGKLERHGAVAGGAGLIPAHAGKTARGRAPVVYGRAHPRSRGENKRMGIPMCSIRGSSPLTRGKLSGKAAEGPRERLIPAHAGKTPLAARSAACAAAHPRSRGENRGNYTSHNVVAGSSPLTRGKHYVDVVPSMKGFGSSPLTRGKLRGAR